MPPLKARHVLLIQAILALSLGALFLLWPGFMMARYNLPFSLAGVAFGRMFGVTLTGFGFLLWAAAKVTGTRAQILVLGALFLANGFSFVIALVQQLAIWETRAGWITAAILFVLTIAFGYNLLAKMRHSADALEAPSRNGRTAVTLLITVNMSALLVTGLVFVFAPGTVVQNIPAGDTGFEPHAFTRFFGTILVSFGLLGLVAGNNARAETQHSLLTALLGANLLGFFMASIQQVTIWNSLSGLALVVTYLLLAMGYAYLRFVAPLLSPQQLATRKEQLRALWQSMEIGLGLQLGLSYLIATLVGVLVFARLQALEIDTLSSLVMALEAAVLLGLLLTANLQRNLHRARTMLSRVAEGQPTPEAPLPAGWPLRQLLTPLNEVAERQREMSDRRRQLRQQVRDAAAQEERNRLARDLHDSIKQQIFSMSVSAAAASARWDHDLEGARAALADVRHNAQAAMVEMNAMLQQLRPAPLENVGLIEALREQCEALAYRTGAQVSTEFGPLPPEDWLPLGAQTSIFRIAQEALANVARHARATRVKLRLDLEGDENEAMLVLTIADDGQGFDPRSPHSGMGLKNMRERAQALGGRLTEDSTPGEGTLIQARIPLLQTEREAPAEDFRLRQVRKQLDNAILVGITTGVVALLVALLDFRSGAWTSGGWVMAMSAGAITGILAVTFTTGKVPKATPASTAAAADQLRAYMHTIRAGSYLGLLLLSLALPLILPGQQLVLAITLAIAVPAGLLAIFEARRSLSSRDFYYRRLAPGQRQALLAEAAAKARTTWAITALMIVSAVANALANGLVFPPQTTLHWVIHVMIGVALALLAWQLANTSFMKQWQQPAPAVRSQEEQGNS